MSLGLGFYGLTTEVSPGAGTKIASIPVTISGQQVEIQLVALSNGGEPISPTNPIFASLVQYGETVRLKSAALETTPSVAQVVLQYTVPSAKILRLKKVKSVCRAETQWVLNINGTLESTGRTGPANPVDTETFSVDLDLTAGQTLELLTTASQFTQPVPVEGYIEALLLDA